MTVQLNPNFPTSSSGLNYKHYVAILNISAGLLIPTVLENDLGFTPTTEAIDNGQWAFDSVNGFPENKTVIFFSPIHDDPGAGNGFGLVTKQWMSASQIRFAIWYGGFSDPTNLEPDDGVVDMSVEIRVYP